MVELIISAIRIFFMIILMIILLIVALIFTIVIILFRVFTEEDILYDRLCDQFFYIDASAVISRENPMA
jgi:hypothetical protein